MSTRIALACLLLPSEYMRLPKKEGRNRIILIFFLFVPRGELRVLTNCKKACLLAMNALAAGRPHQQQEASQKNLLDIHLGKNTCIKRNIKSTRGKEGNIGT